MVDQVVPIRIYVDADKATKEAREFNQELGKTSTVTRKAERGTDEFNRELKGTRRAGAQAATGVRDANTATAAFGRSVKTAGQALVAFGAALSVREIAAFVTSTATAADNVALLQTRLEVLTGSSGAFNQLVNLSEDLGIALNTTDQVFGRFAIGTEQIGFTAGQVADLTEVVFKLGRIGGSSMQDLTNASIQLGQSLGSGVFQGEELRSVLESMPLVARRIAEGLGVSVGELKQLGSEGKLTSEVIGGILLGAVEEVRQKFDELPNTVAQSRQRMLNEWHLTLAAIGRAIDSSPFFQELFEGIGRSLRGFREALDYQSSTLKIEVDISKLRAEALRQEEIFQTLRTEGKLSAEGILSAETAINDLISQRVVLETKLAEIRDKEGSDRTDRTFGTREPVGIPTGAGAPPEGSGAVEIFQREQIELKAFQDVTLQEYADYWQKRTQVALEGVEEQKRIQEAAQAEERQREQQHQQAMAGALAGISAAAAAAFGRNSRSYQIAAASQATIAALLAGNQVLADPKLDSFTKTLKMLEIIGIGFANVASIRSTAIPRASGGEVQPGNLYSVGEIQPEIFRADGGQQYLIPRAGGRVEPLNATGGQSGVRISVQNHGTNAEVTNARQLDSGEVELILEQADRNARVAFDDELRYGYGSYNASLRSHTTLRRRVS